MERKRGSQMAQLGCVLFLWFTVPLGRTVHVSPGFSVPGDINIAGLFPIHKGILNTSLTHPAPPECIGLNLVGLNKALVMIQAVESINNSPMLGGIKLGYCLFDSCSDVTTALYVTKSIMDPAGGCGAQMNSSSGPRPIMAVIGATISEVSIAVARQLNLELIPQISYGSTALILSNKDRFPAFMRTVPSDNHQTNAMVKLLRANGWNWVGIVTTDGEYGRAALNSFVSQTAEAGICIAFKEILPVILSDSSYEDKISRAVKAIRADPKVKVIVAFATPTHMQAIFSSLGGGAQGKVWVASDAWSTSESALGGRSLSSVGTVVGFTFKTGDTPSFLRYLRGLRHLQEPPKNSSFVKELRAWQNHTKAQGWLPTKTLMNNIKPESIFSINLAISAVAHAVAKLCSVKDCRSSKDLHPWELLTELRESTFQMEGKNYTFDSNGDLTLGYDITLWSSDKGVVSVNDVVAQYDIRTRSFSYTSQDTREKILDLKKVESRCSPTCQPGQFKKTAEGQHVCCYECMNCTENHFSNDTDTDECFSCDTDIAWAPAGHTYCIHKTLEFFTWEDGFGMVLLALATLGILLAYIMVVLFLRHRHTPVVKAAGGPICYLMLLSLGGSFISTILFVGRPTNLQCQVRQVLYGVSFTCCVSCILVKSLKILLAFHFKSSVRTALHRLYRPYWIIGVCVGLQAVLCTLWLVLCSPRVSNIPNPTTILVECFEGSYVAFGAMLGYIAVLALMCFGCAFKGRKLPENYNEAKFITFGMLIYFISWVTFIPTYVTTSGKYLPAVEMVVILISNYGESGRPLLLRGGLCA
ncbi:hypothetical protein COCON_G00009890 [Conger conger]|uniref:G-protein coupled receptor family C group 6 member A n=1 Tax=Conger conger TaxID=82655 RepID=A0A9Q1I8X2_CONCO|nr:hypothetical protein COCON_G00009890 [Conger conger]